MSEWRSQTGPYCASDAANYIPCSEQLPFSVQCSKYLLFPRLQDTPLLHFDNFPPTPTHDSLILLIINHPWVKCYSAYLWGYVCVSRWDLKQVNGRHISNSFLSDPSVSYRHRFSSWHLYSKVWSEKPGCCVWKLFIRLWQNPLHSLALLSSLC